MNRAEPRSGERQRSSSAFTLIELLVVIAIVAILAAILLPILSRVKNAAYTIKCKSNLRQLGIALQAYVDEYSHKYPFYGDPADYYNSPAYNISHRPGSFRNWEASLEPYHKPGWWRDQSCQCPSVTSDVYSRLTGLPTASKLYAYNWYGTEATGSVPGTDLRVGLGNMVHEYNGSWQVEAISESKVRYPSEMFAIFDSRIFPYADLSGYGSPDHMVFGAPSSREKPRHGSGPNMLFCDGHVNLTRFKNWIDFRKTGQNWNNDHDPHSNTWDLAYLP